MSTCIHLYELVFHSCIALCTRMYPYVTRLSLVVPVWCSSHDRFFFSVEPKGHGCARIRVVLLNMLAFMLIFVTLPSPPPDENRHPLLH